MLCQKKYEMKDVAEWEREVAAAVNKFRAANNCWPNLLVASSKLLNQIDDYEMAEELFYTSPQMHTEVVVDDHAVTICADDDMGDKDFKLINDPVAIISSQGYSRTDWAEVVCGRMKSCWQRMDPSVDVKCLHWQSRVWFVMDPIRNNRTRKFKNEWMMFQDYPSQYAAT